MYWSRFPEIVRELEPKLDGVAKRGAGLVAVDAKIRAPVQTGALKAAIHVEKDEQTGGYLVVAGDDADVFYGNLVENGTSHSAPRPFLVPAFEEARPLIQAMGAATLKTL